MKLDSNKGKADEARRSDKRKGTTSVKSSSTKPSKKKKDEAKT